MIVLVTGDRRWPRGKIELIEESIAKALLSTGKKPPWHLIVGGSRGVDTYALELWKEMGHSYQVVEADWFAPCKKTCAPGHRKRQKGTGKSYCPAAGPYRNGMMIDMKPDLVLAFPVRNRSIGTWNCIDQAVKAGIPTIITFIDGTVEVR